MKTLSVQNTDTPQDLLFSETNGLPSGDYGAAFVKMFLTLVVLVSLLILTTWFLKRLMRARLEKGFGNQMIHVLEKRVLSPKTMLYIIEVEGHRMMLAESQLEVKNCLHIPSDAPNRNLDPSL